MAKIVVVERRMTAYRAPFFELLRDDLQRLGHRLELLTGPGTAAEDSRRDTGTVDWAHWLPTRYWLDGQVCWQPFGRYIHDADLVIVNHENKLIYNHWITAARRPARLGFWGHAGDLQSRQSRGVKVAVRNWTARAADWWFAYTDSTAKRLHALGFSDERITVLNNTIDVDPLIRQIAAIDENTRGELRAELAGGAAPAPNAPIAVYIGSLYRHKRIDWLVEAGAAVHRRISAFRLIVAGDGPDRAVIEQACRQHPWLRFAGAVYGERKAQLLAAADMMLMPGAIGLGVLDSFVSGKPMITTNCGIHGPEADYLIDGRNGVISADTLEDFSAAVVRVAADAQYRARLGANALADAPQFSLGRMSERFCDGVQRALAVR